VEARLASSGEDNQLEARLTSSGEASLLMQG